MPLFTVIADYGGGTYLAQVRARSAREAAIAWPESPAVAELALLLDLPIATFKEVLREPEVSPVRSLSRCWCVTADLGDQLLLLHIVQTAEIERRK
jgi:hypothetical protein